MYMYTYILMSVHTCIYRHIYMYIYVHIPILLFLLFAAPMIDATDQDTSDQAIPGSSIVQFYQLILHNGFGAPEKKDGPDPCGPPLGPCGRGPCGAPMGPHGPSLNPPGPS